MARVYISGPISGYDIEERRTEFARVEKILELEGHEVLNPLGAGWEPGHKTEYYMRRDLAMLLAADSIFMMRRWKHSAGCKLEFDVAVSIDLEVRFEEVTNVKFE